MDPYYEFANLAGDGQNICEVFHFSWRNDRGEKGDYGLNVGPCEKIFHTLISTTFMFQDQPDFILECRPYKMTQEQVDFLHENDLDTLKFLNGIIPTGKPFYELDLSQHRSQESAFRALAQIVP